jgi:hypothetical protein
MPVCTHPQCYNHVATSGTQCTEHTAAKPKTKSSRPTDKQFAIIHNNCLWAANKAMAAVTPTAMFVDTHADQLNDHSPIVERQYAPNGVCGYTGLYLPRNRAFTKWLIQHHYAYDYGSFVGLETPKDTQSYEKLRAWSAAFRQKMTKLYPEYARRIKFESFQT